MMRGRSMRESRLARGKVAAEPVIRATEVVVPPTADRVINTAEANAFLRKAKGFLEKRRSSGVDSPRYLQRVKRGAVLYRVSDLIAWENERTLTCSSEHDEPLANGRQIR